MVVVMVTVACQATTVPGAGDWRATATHFASALPGPRVLKKSCADFMAA
jgi:hypothetical protein